MDDLRKLIHCIHKDGHLEMDDYLAEVDEESLGTLEKTLLDFMLYHRDMRRAYEDLLAAIRKLPSL